MSEMKSLTLNGEKYDSFVDVTARALSVGSAIIGSTSGENITLYDASNYNLLDLHIYGKTTQDGTPTPDAPVELVSVGDSGSITVNTTGKKDSKSMTVATPNGLPGIPVSSGGNCIDENGQKWICDEIDLAEGVYIQRCGHYVFNGTEEWASFLSRPDTYAYTYTCVPRSERQHELRIRCNIGTGRSWEDSSYCLFINEYEQFVVGEAALQGSANVDEFKVILANHPIEVIYPLETPIETPLSEEELAAYADLRTYRNQVTVSNDAGVHMEIEYVMDAKKYIDNLVISGGGSVARLTSVTLLASSWTGSKSPYSQVVSIPGVTEYSKVDLLPSVEQLAIFHEKDVAFVTENEDGVVTVYAIGDKPLLDYTMQAQITEVLV